MRILILRGNEMLFVRSFKAEGMEKNMKTEKWFFAWQLSWGDLDLELGYWRSLPILTYKVNRVSPLKQTTYLPFPVIIILIAVEEKFRLWYFPLSKILRKLFRFGEIILFPDKSGLLGSKSEAGWTP